jgi:hypothetical protein
MGRRKRGPRPGKGKGGGKPAASTGRRNRRIILTLALLCLAVALVYAARSPGTYQDDDLDRYYMARQVWKDPSLLADDWGMPAPLVLFAAPARLAGYGGVEATTAVVVAAGAAMAGLAAEAAGLAFPWLAVPFFFFQPLVLETSYGGLAEPIAAMLLAAVLWAWYTGRRERAVLLAGLLPLARIEAGVLTLVVLAAAWPRVGWKARVGAFVPGAVWAAAGWALHGTPFYVLGSGNERPLLSLGPLQYARNGIVVIGAVVLFFFLWALVAALRSRKPVSAPSEAPPRFPALAAILVGTDVVVLSLLAWEALPFGRSVGFLRHIAVVAPALALVAARGTGDWSGLRLRPRSLRVGFAVAWTAVVALFLSHVLVGESFIGPGRVEWRWVVTAVLGAAGVLLLAKPRLVAPRWAAVAAGVGAAALALSTVHPIGLDPERAAVKAATEKIEEMGLGNAVVYTNHPWFAFFSGRDRYDTALTPKLTRANLAAARPGSVVLWENHYGPRLWGDVPDTLLRNDPHYERLMELVAGKERNFHVVVFLRKG